MTLNNKKIRNQIKLHTFNNKSFQINFRFLYNLDRVLGEKCNSILIFPLVRVLLKCVENPLKAIVITACKPV